MIQQKLTKTKTTMIFITETVVIFLLFSDIHTRSFGGSAIEFWHQKEQSNIYTVLTLIAQDLVSAPSSQAFVERLFSVCGTLTLGRAIEWICH